MFLYYPQVLFIMKYQTRSSSGELKYFDLLKDALKEIEQDPQIWKLSYNHITGTYKRWVKSTRVNLIHVASDEELRSLSDKYNDTNIVIFWYNQPLLDGDNTIKELLDNEEFKNPVHHCCPIREILSR